VLFVALKKIRAARAARLSIAFISTSFSLSSLTPSSHLPSSSQPSYSPHLTVNFTALVSRDEAQIASLVPNVAEISQKINSRK
jgi:hypothetical protein